MGEGRRLPQSFRARLWHSLIGKAKDPHDPDLKHQLALAAFLAWVGLGVDGLSSSAYGPEEAFRVLGHYWYLAIPLAIATALTVWVISFSYSRVIERFPEGGGGYHVATQLLGKPAGVVSGCALLVDYVLTITTSIAGGGDAVFSLFPPRFLPFKLPAEFIAISVLIILNLRGLKESIRVLVPFFLLFVVTHVIVICGGVMTHFGELGNLASSAISGYNADVAQIGKWGLFLLFLRAYSMGGGTYTGIEAVSNGVATLREPRVLTGKRTMLYLGVSLALTAGGLLFCYMLFRVVPVPGKTLNAVLIESFAGAWNIRGIPIGYWFVMVTLFSEAFLLFTAAQTGFIDGPRVMANMALDSWLPRRFATLSDRLTGQNGILLMGVAAMALLSFTGGHITLLVVMYSINVFITFSMTQAAMARYWFLARKTQPRWRSNLAIHVIGFLLCFAILWVMILEKFLDGAWATLVITGAAISICLAVRRHYLTIGQRIKHVEARVKEDARLLYAPTGTQPAKPVPDFDSDKPTAVILVGGYSKLGRRSLTAVLKFFPNTFHNVVFLSIGVVNSEFFAKGSVDSLEKRTEEVLKGYQGVANRLGLPARYAFRVGTDVVREASQLCLEVSKQYPHSMFFAGELIFEQPNWWDKILHNETAYAIQREIRYAGLPMVILPLVLHGPNES